MEINHNSIRKIRKERHLTQKQLAEKVGVPQQYISKLENGQLSPTLESFCKVLKALDCALVIEGLSYEEK